MKRIYMDTLDINEIIGLFDDLFNNEFDDIVKSPVHDVIKTENEIIIELELAGIDKEDITISTEEDMLTVEAECNVDDELTYIRKERNSGKLKRIFRLPENADIENIEASHDNGLLTLKIPKIVEEKLKKKKIIIN